MGKNWHEGFFSIFEGIKRRTYDSDRPPLRFFKNGPSGALFKDFVTATLLYRIKNGRYAYGEGGRM